MHRRRVMGENITYVGLDVHRDGIVVALAEGGLRGEVRDYGRIANTPAALHQQPGDRIGEIMRARRTQTNVPERCASDGAGDLSLPSEPGHAASCPWNRGQLASGAGFGSDRCQG